MSLGFENAVASLTTDISCFRFQELSFHKKQGPGLLSKVGQTVRAAALSMRGLKGRPEEFVQMSDFIETFTQKINLIDKISQRIYKEERGMSNHWDALLKLLGPGGSSLPRGGRVELAPPGCFLGTALGSQWRLPSPFPVNTSPFSALTV